LSNDYFFDKPVGLLHYVTTMTSHGRVDVICHITA